MPFYTVKQGEWMGSIATEHGFPVWRSIWQLAENAGLRSKRDPEVLFPGDVIWLPERGQKHVPRPTDAKHKFTSLSDKAKLRLRFVDVDPFIQAIGPIPFTLETEDGGSLSGKITEEGQVIELSLSSKAQRGTLRVGGFQMIEIGALDPLDTASGMQGRLKNLGLNPGPVDNIAGPLTAAAVREFQKRNKIKVDGIIGPQTRGKMKEVYGC